MGYDAKTLVDGMDGWSRVHRSAPINVDVDGTLLQVARPGKGCLSYVLVSHREAVVFDPSHYPGIYETLIEGYDAELIGVYDTHAHADHVSGGRELADRNDVPYCLHPADAIGLNAKPLRDEERFEVGGVDIKVIPIPLRTAPSGRPASRSRAHRDGLDFDLPLIHKISRLHIAP